jgi:hypothetical protein
VIISRKMGWVGYIISIDDLRNAYNILVGKPEKK